MTLFRSKFIILKKRYLVLAFAVVGVIAIFAAVLSPSIIGPSGGKRILPIYSVMSTNRDVSLTFNVTAETDLSDILAVLDEYNICATFFVTGSWIDAFPQQAVTLYNCGHELMNLSDEYSSLKTMSSEEIIASISACNNKIWAITGSSPIFCRAPYGEYHDNTVAAASSAGMQMVQWSFDLRDVSSTDKAVISVMKKKLSGSILLLDTKSPDTLSAVIRTLTADNYNIIPLSKLTLQEQYTINSFGVQIPN